MEELKPQIEVKSDQEATSLITSQAMNQFFLKFQSLTDVEQIGLAKVMDEHLTKIGAKAARKNLIEDENFICAQMQIGSNIVKISKSATKDTIRETLVDNWMDFVPEDKLVTRSVVDEEMTFMNISQEEYERIPKKVVETKAPAKITVTIK